MDGAEPMALETGAAGARPDSSARKRRSRCVLALLAAAVLAGVAVAVIFGVVLTTDDGETAGYQPDFDDDANRDPGSCPPGSAPYLHSDYVPRGAVIAEDVAGVDLYESLPRGERPALVRARAATRGVVLLPDVWGWSGGRTRAIADFLADAGARVVVPKVLQPAWEGGTDGDGLPPGFSGSMGPFLDGIPWRGHTDARVEAALDYLRGQGVTQVGLVGFCWGGWALLHASADFGESHNIVAGASAHPSLGIASRFDSSPTALASAAWRGAPVLLLPSAGEGSSYDPDGAVTQALARAAPGSSSHRYPDMRHGWVPRGDISDPDVARDTEDALHRIGTHLIARFNVTDAAEGDDVDASDGNGGDSEASDGPSALDDGSCPPGSAPYLQADYPTRGSVVAAADAGVDLYEVLPSSDRPEVVQRNAQTRGVVVLPDVWGWHAGRTRAIADWLADSGARVVVPKILQPAWEGGTDGDGLPPGFTGSMSPFLDGIPWRDHTDARVEAALDYLHGEGATRVALVGFCWGGWALLHASADFGASHGIVAGATAHPSLSIGNRFGESPTELAAAVWRDAPILMLPSGGESSAYDPDGAITAALASAAHGSSSLRYPEMVSVDAAPPPPRAPPDAATVCWPAAAQSHGWVPRGDMSDPDVARDTEDALRRMGEHILARFNATEPDAEGP